MPKYTQKQFDSELCKMLQEAKDGGQQSCRIVSRDLHDRVVTQAENRMPMACGAMWKLLKQGSHNGRIIKTTQSGQSSTITIEFSTDKCTRKKP